MSKRVAVMQPYFFPYIGYFQLIAAVDYFVFYDDVNFIKRGWINRNNILLSNKSHLINIPLEKASQNRLIKDTYISNNFNPEKLLKTIHQSYKKAPYFNKIMPLIESVLLTTTDNIGQLAANSVISVLNYLEIEKKLLFSSKNFADTKGMDKSDRLIAITKKCGATIYTNPIGGKALYAKEYFKKNNIELQFLQAKPHEYKQFSSPFIPNLSIIDMMMFCSKYEIKEMLNEYKLQ